MNAVEIDAAISELALLQRSGFHRAECQTGVVEDDDIFNGNGVFPIPLHIIDETVEHTRNGSIT